MANFVDFLSNFPYPASYLASAHKDSSEGALANKKKLSPMVTGPKIRQKLETLRHFLGNLE